MKIFAYYILLLLFMASLLTASAQRKKVNRQMVVVNQSKIDSQNHRLNIWTIPSLAQTIIISPEPILSVDYDRSIFDTSFLHGDTVGVLVKTGAKLSSSAGLRNYSVFTVTGHKNSTNLTLWFDVSSPLAFDKKSFVIKLDSTKATRWRE